MKVFNIPTSRKNIEAQKRISCLNWSCVWTVYYDGFGNFDKN